MPLCDLCGKNTQLVRAEIERATLRVCSDCARYGKVTSAAKPETFEPPKEIGKLPAKILETEEGIDGNCAMIVKTAREKAKLTQEELAKAIAEKENIIHRIETKQQEPPLKIARKLEQFLHIKLIKKEAPQKTPALKDIDFSETDLTIGDLVEISKQLKDP